MLDASQSLLPSNVRSGRKWKWPLVISLLLGRSLVIHDGMMLDAGRILVGMLQGGQFCRTDSFWPYPKVTGDHLKSDDFCSILLGGTGFHRVASRFSYAYP